VIFGYSFMAREVVAAQVLVALGVAGVRWLAASMVTLDTGVGRVWRPVPAPRVPANSSNEPRTLVHHGVTGDESRSGVCARVEGV